MPFLSKDGVHPLVQYPPILDHALAERTLAPVAGVLEHARRGRVAGEWQRVEAPQLFMGAEGTAGYCPERRTRNPAAPELVTHPVADLGADALHIVVQCIADPAYYPPRRLDGEEGGKGL